MLSDLITVPFCKGCLAWIALIEDTQSFVVEDMCSLTIINKLLCKFLSCPIPAVFETDVAAVKKARKLYGHNTYQVSELLEKQTKSLGDTVVKHISEARARGTNVMVNARLATISRSLNFERLAIFKDKEQMLLVIELLVRIGTQTASGKDWAKSKYVCLPKHQKDAVQLYLDATIELVKAEDMPLARIEEMKRHINVQLAQQSMNMEEELSKHRAKVAEMHKINKKLRKVNEHSKAEDLEREVKILKWELMLVENVVMESLKVPLVQRNRAE